MQVQGSRRSVHTLPRPGTSSRVKTCSGVKQWSMPATSRQTSTRSRGEPDATTCRRPCACSASTVFALSCVSRVRKSSAEPAIWSRKKCSGSGLPNSATKLASPASGAKPEKSLLQSSSVTSVKPAAWSASTSAVLSRASESTRTPSQSHMTRSFSAMEADGADILADGGVRSVRGARSAAAQPRAASSKPIFGMI